METQDPIKRTLISTALAFTLSILTWYIYSSKAEADLLKANEQASAHSQETTSTTSISN